MADTRSARRGVAIFRGEDATALTNDFMGDPSMSTETAEAFSDVIAAGLRAGSEVRVLVPPTRDSGSFSLIHLWYKPNYPLVRHTHDADCMYYVISGDASLGNQVIRRGDSFFVPGGAPYRYTAGPEGVEILEVRHGVAHFSMEIPDASTNQWEAMKTVAVANRDDWGSRPTSPTFTAPGR